MQGGHELTCADNNLLCFAIDSLLWCTFGAHLGHRDAKPLRIEDQAKDRWAACCQAGCVYGA